MSAKKNNSSALGGDNNSPGQVLSSGRAQRGPVGQSNRARQEDLTMPQTREILFVDPGVADIETFLGHLRPGVEAVLLDPVRPPARQIVAALAGAGIGG